MGDQSSCFFTIGHSPAHTVKGGFAVSRNVTYYAGPGAKHHVDLLGLKGSGTGGPNLVSKSDAQVTQLIGKGAEAILTSLTRLAEGIPKCGVGSRLERARF